MKNKSCLLNTFLAVVFGLYLLVAVLIRTFSPTVLLPKADIPNLVLLSLAALVMDHYAAPFSKRNYLIIPVMAALTFGLLPWAASFATPKEALHLALAGALVFTVTTWLFTAIQERLSSGPAAKASALFSAVSLYMASQCFMGIL